MHAEASQPQPNTTATLKSLLLTTTRAVSSLPSQAPQTLHDHVSLKHHFQHLLHHIRCALTTHIQTLTKSLQTSQRHLKNLSTTFSTLSAELSYHTQLRARYFEESVHQLSLITRASSENASLGGNPPLGIASLSSLSLLPFVKPAGEFRVSPQKRARRETYTRCVMGLKQCDDTVRRLEATRCEVGRDVKELKYEVMEGLRNVKEAIRCDGEWGIVQMLVGVVDDGFEEFEVVHCSGIWSVVNGRWNEVFENVERVGEVVVDVEDVEVAVEEIRRFVMDVCIVT